MTQKIIAKECVKAGPKLTANETDSQNFTGMVRPELHALWTTSFNRF